MKCELVGIEYVNYTSKKTNKDVKGYRLYVNYEKDNVQGFATDNIFIAEDLLAGHSVGDEVEILYNKYGRVAEIR